MISSKILDVLGAAFFLVFGAALFFLSRRLEVPGDGWMVDRGFWPKWIGILMIALSIGMAIQGWRALASSVDFLPRKPAWLLLGSFAAFNLLLPVLGYFAASFLWLVVLGMIAGERSALKLSAFAIVCVALCYVVVWKILMVPLPVGELERVLGLDQWIYR